MAVPLLPDRPAAALAAASEAVAQASAVGPVRLIGSSMGGFYATVLAERHGLSAVLVNPSVQPHRRLDRYVGEQTNPYTGARTMIDLGTADELASMVPPMIQPERYWLLVQTGDEVLDYQDAVAWYAGCRQTVEPEGDHQFQGFDRYLPEVVRFLQCSGFVEQGLD